MASGTCNVFCMIASTEELWSCPRDERMTAKGVDGRTPLVQLADVCVCVVVCVLVFVCGGGRRW